MECQAATSKLTDPVNNSGSITNAEDHEKLAEEVELKSAVLLQNGTGGTPVLPLSAAAQNIAVVGPDQDFSLVSSSVPKSCPRDAGPWALHLPFRDRRSTWRSRLGSSQRRPRQVDRTVCRHQGGRRRGEP